MLNCFARAANNFCPSRISTSTRCAPRPCKPGTQGTGHWMGTPGVVPAIERKYQKPWTGWWCINPKKTWVISTNHPMGEKKRKFRSPQLGKIVISTNEHGDLTNQNGISQTKSCCVEHVGIYPPHAPWQHVNRGSSCASTKMNFKGVIT